MAFKRASKGITLVAAAALVTTSFAALPANAAVSRLTSAPIAGSSKSAILGSAFVFRTAAAGANTDGQNITYLVTGADSTELEVDVEIVSSVTGLTAEDFTGGDDYTLDEDGDDNTYLSIDDTVTNSNPYVLVSVALDLDDVTASTAVTLTPFEDVNNDGVFDEDVDGVKGSAFTISFVKASEVNVAATVANDTQAGTSEVSIEFTGLNGGSMLTTGDLTTFATFETFTDGATNGEVTIDEADYDGDNLFVDSDTTNVEPESIITTKIYVADETKAAATIRQDLAASDVASYDEISVASTQNYVLDNADFDVRSGDGSFTITMDVLDADDVGVAGETVTWVITDDDLDEGTVKAGGKTLEAGDDPIKPTSVTDADGTASLTISYTDLADGESFDVEASVLSSGIAANAAVSFDAADSSEFTVFVTNSVEDAAIVAEVEQSVTVNLALRDEYGLVPTGSYRLLYNVSGDPLEIDIDKYAVFTNGSASIKIDDTTDTGDLDITAVEHNVGDADALQKKDDDGAWTIDLAVALEGQTTVTIVDEDELTAVSKVEFDTANSHDADADAVPILGQTLFAADTRLQTNDDFDSDAADIVTLAEAGDSNVLIVETYDSENLGTVGGANVTFSAAGVMFYDSNKEVFGLGSITVATEADGTATVYFASNTAGEHTVTATSSGKSDTITVVVEDAADDSGSEWVVSAPANATPGSTFVFTATLVDEWGNPVTTADDTVEIDYEGPGLVSGTLPTETNASGKIRLAVLLGTSDLGEEITVNVTWDDGIADAVEADEFTATVGASAAAGKVNVGSFNGKLVVYAAGLNGARISWKVGGNWGKAVATSNFARFDRVTPKKGVTVSVDIYVNGVKTLTKSVVTR